MPILQDYPTHLCTTLGFRGILSYTYINCNCKFVHMYIHKCLYTLNKLIHNMYVFIVNV